MNAGSNGGPVAVPAAAPRSEPVAATPAPAARAGLSTVTQVAILVVVAVASAGLFGFGQFGLALLRPKAASTEATASTPAIADTSFKPTAAQWGNLRFAPATMQVFQDIDETDGKIALDDDLTTTVFSPYSGRVSSLFAKAGDIVPAGAPLLAIEASEFVQAQNDLVTAVSALATTRAQLRLTQTAEKRQHDLFAANAGALKDWQQSQVDLANAQGGLNSAEIALGAVRNRLRILGKTDQEVADLEASRNTQHFNPSAVVVAPIAGTVTQRQVGLGQYIVNQASGGSNPVFTIGNLSRVWLVANVRETDASHVHLNDPVEVKVLALPERVFKAHVVYVAPSIDPNTHRLTVRAEIDNHDGLLKPEMYAAFRIMTDAGAPNPSVPDSAIVYEGETAHVFAADPNAKTIAIRQVKLGRSFEGRAEVLEGLKANEQVVTSGALFIDRALQDN